MTRLLLDQFPATDRPTRSDPIARESTSRLANVVLGIVTLAKGKQLQEFTGQVLIGAVSVVGRPIEGELQGWIQHHGSQKLAIGCQELRAHVTDLPIQEFRPGKLTPVDGKDTKPELNQRIGIGLGTEGQAA